MLSIALSMLLSGGQAGSPEAALTGPVIEEKTVSTSVVETYIAGIEPRFAATVRALDAAMMSVHADFTTRISYGLLLYALPGAPLSQWTCAIGVTSKLVNLRFLYGFLFDDQHHVLRAGAGILRTIDFAPEQELDMHMVTDYVKQAVARFDDYKAYARSQKQATSR
jgi:hypothetical protein